MLQLQAIADWLDTELESYVAVDVNLFAGYRPAHAPTDTPCTVIIERYPARLEKDGSRIVRKSLRFVSRGPDYPSAQEEARQYFDACIHRTGITLEGWNLLSVSPGTEPQYTGQDEFGHVFWTDLTFNVKEVTT
jgi:hypothetical protein